MTIHSPSPTHSLFLFFSPSSPLSASSAERASAGGFAGRACCVALALVQILLVLAHCAGTGDSHQVVDSALVAVGDCRLAVALAIGGGSVHAKARLNAKGDAGADGGRARSGCCGGVCAGGAGSGCGGSGRASRRGCGCDSGRRGGCDSGRRGGGARRRGCGCDSGRRGGGPGGRHGGAGRGRDAAVAEEVTGTDCGGVCRAGGNTQALVQVLLVLAAVARAGHGLAGVAVPRALVAVGQRWLAEARDVARQRRARQVGAHAGQTRRNCGSTSGGHSRGCNRACASGGGHSRGCDCGGGAGGGRRGRGHSVGGGSGRARSRQRGGGACGAGRSAAAADIVDQEVDGKGLGGKVGKVKLNDHIRRGRGNRRHLCVRHIAVCKIVANAKAKHLNVGNRLEGCSRIGNILGRRTIGNDNHRGLATAPALRGGQQLVMNVVEHGSKGRAGVAGVGDVVEGVNNVAHVLLVEVGDQCGLDVVQQGGHAVILGENELVMISSKY